MPVRRAAAAALLIGLLAGACSSSGSKDEQAKPSRPDDQVVAGDLTLDTVAWDEVSPRKALGPLDDVNRAAVMKTLQATFDATVVDPITTGTAGSVEQLFTADAAARATGPDRAALFDEGLPRVRAKALEATKANVRLTALDGGDGPKLVVAKIDWDVRGADVHVKRIGELSLVPAFGTWVVGAYTVITSRTAGGSTTTTTAVSG